MATVHESYQEMAQAALSGARESILLAGDRPESAHIAQAYAQIATAYSTLAIYTYLRDAVLAVSKP